LDLKPDYKKLFLLGLIAYPLLLLLSLVFYQERTIFTDIAFHLFFMAKDQEFAIQNYRFGAAVTQLFPLAGFWSGASLQTIMLLYSSAFILFNGCCYLFIGFVQRDYRLALVLLCSQLFIAADSFYWIQSELPQGLAMLVISFALLGRVWKGGMQILWWLLLTLSLVTTAFCHPLLVFPFSFLVVFFWLDSQDYSRKNLVIASAIYLAAWVTKAVLFRTPYDSGAMGGLNNFRRLWPDYFTIYSNKQFLSDLVHKFFWVLPVLVGAMAVYFRFRRRLKSFFLLAFFIGYLLLINISYPGRDVTAFYIENMYLPLGLFLAAAFVFDILPALKSRSLHLLMVLLVMLTCIPRIYSYHRAYSDRLGELNRLLDKYRNEKVIIDEKDADMSKLMMTWGTSYEFWLLSMTQTGSTASIIISDQAQQLSKSAEDPRAFMITWNPLSYAELQGKYYVFPDTVTKYRLVKP
jgi:fumarate reductase subunit D